MTAAQLSEIRTYLLGKRLPIDILMEVEDHFITQITELEHSGLAFPDALRRVQDAWLSDLKMTYDARYSLDDIAPLTKKIIWSHQRLLLKKALLLAAGFSILAACAGALLPTRALGITLVVAYVLAAVPPLLRFILRRKDFLLPRKYPNFKLSVFQGANTISLLIFGPTLGWLPWIDDFSEAPSHHPGKVVALGLVFFIWFSFHAFCFLNQTEYLKALARVKPYLQKTQLG